MLFEMLFEMMITKTDETYQVTQIDMSTWKRERERQRDREGETEREVKDNNNYDCYKFTKQKWTF